MPDSNRWQHANGGYFFRRCPGGDVEMLDQAVSESLPRSNVPATVYFNARIWKLLISGVSRTHNTIPGYMNAAEFHDGPLERGVTPEPVIARNDALRALLMNVRYSGFTSVDDPRGYSHDFDTEVILIHKILSGTPNLPEERSGPGRRDMDMEREKHLIWLEQQDISPTAYKRAARLQRSTIVDTGAHTGYPVVLDRRVVVGTQADRKGAFDDHS